MLSPGKSPVCKGAGRWGTRYWLVLHAVWSSLSQLPADSVSVVGQAASDLCPGRQITANMWIHVFLDAIFLPLPAVTLLDYDDFFPFSEIYNFPSVSSLLGGLGTAEEQRNYSHSTSVREGDTDLEGTLG